MPKNSALRSVHQSGEAGQEGLIESGASAVDTFGGKVFVRWDPDAHVTGFGPVAYFLEFLKTNGLWQSWVQDCPLHYRSGNAPPKQDILGTVMLSVLAGHKRYAHITTVRSDSVLPELLSMKRVRSEDAAPRAFQHGEEEPYTVCTIAGAAKKLKVHRRMVREAIGSALPYALISRREDGSREQR